MWPIIKLMLNRKVKLIGREKTVINSNNINLKLINKFFSLSHPKKIEFILLILIKILKIKKIKAIIITNFNK